MLALVIPLLLAGPPVHAWPTCDDTLYYGELIETVIRTGRVPFGQMSDHTTFAEYVEALGPDFNDALRRARPDDTWINFGAGRALAEREFLASAANGPRVVSVSAHRPDEDAPVPPATRHRHLSGQLIEDMDWSTFAKAQIGSDRFGPLSYSKHFDRALRVEGEALAPGARLFVVLQTGRTHFFERGRELSICDYLGRVRGLRLERPVTCVPNRANLIRFVLRREAGPVVVPPLHVRRLKFRLPPLREYDLP